MKKALSVQKEWKLRGLGEKIAEMLARLDIHNLSDLLCHLPLRYQDRTQVQLIRQLSPGQEAVIEGERMSD